MTAQTPCQAGDADDWFIGRDGLQYPDEPFTASDEEVAEVISKRRWEGVEGKEAHARAFVVGQKRREALIRRRKAKQACFDCPLRLPCLTMSLDLKPAYGIYGGYYEEERAKIIEEMGHRRQGVD